MLINEDSTQRAIPPSSTRKPSTKNGTELLIRWSQPACRNGAVKISGSPSSSWAWMPKLSRRSPLSWSKNSSTHSPARSTAISSAAPRGRGDEVVTISTSPCPAG